MKKIQIVVETSYRDEALHLCAVNVEWDIGDSEYEYEYIPAAIFVCLWDGTHQYYLEY